MSPEINFLLANVKAYVGTIDKIEIEKTAKNANWEKINKLSFHALYGLLGNNLKESTNKYIHAYQNTQRNQAFKNLQTSHELKQLFHLFNENDIKFIPYKGVLFSAEVFDNQSIRLSGDADILFLPEDREKVFNLLLKLDYKFDLISKEANLSDQEIILGIVENNFVECQMSKNGIAIDIHWGLFYDFYHYKIPYSFFFENTKKKPFFGLEINFPKVSSIFWMIIVHHGGKENWMRLKHILDFAVFMKKHKENLDWSVEIQRAKQFKLYTQMIAGFQILKDQVNIALPKEIETELIGFNKELCKPIYAYWEKGQYWNTLIPRLKYERVFISLQDSDFSTPKYIYRFLKSYSIPTPVFNDRFITFPKSFVVLNALSKVISYTIRKFK